MKTKSSHHMGHCVTCWNKGHPSTLVSAPPSSRCIDRNACEMRRIQNASKTTGKVIMLAVQKKVPESEAIVETEARSRIHYFRRVRKYVKNTEGHDVLVREDVELVPERTRASRFPLSMAKNIARAWGGQVKVL